MTHKMADMDKYTKKVFMSHLLNFHKEDQMKDFYEHSDIKPDPKIDSLIDEVKL